MKEIERDDAEWEIEGKGRLRDGSRGELELKIDAWTGRIHDVDDEHRISGKRDDDDDDHDDDD